MSGTLILNIADNRSKVFSASALASPNYPFWASYDPAATCQSPEECLARRLTSEQKLSILIHCLPDPLDSPLHS